MPASGIGGPCDHCGRTQSCCWRRGPSNKPILCNACGSRYLVKKNLDGYVPVQQRAGSVTKVSSAPQRARGKPKQSSPTLTGTLKSKRGATKKLDSAMWYQDSLDSEESEAAAYLTDDSEIPSSSGQQVPDLMSIIVPAAARGRSLLSEPHRTSTKVLHITSTAQLNGLKGLTSEDVARLLEPTLRSKPRKPVHPRISVVF